MSSVKYPNVLVLDFPMTDSSGQTFVDHYVDLSSTASIKLGAHDYDLVSIIYNISSTHVTCEVLLIGTWVYYDDLDGPRLLKKNIRFDKLPSFCAVKARAQRIAHLILVRRN
jgi:hypothetical protein